jgi:hypothetical protein
MMTVRLTAQQREYLREATFLPDDLRARLARSPNPTALEVDADTANELTSAFTVRLAEAGFDEDYEVTAEGALLEDLIDRFSVTS